MLAPWKNSYDKSRKHIKKQRHHFANKGPYSQSYGVSSSHVWMWEMNHKEGWLLRIEAFELWCWRRLLRVPWMASRSSQSILRKSILNIHWKDWCWSWSSNTMATWYKQPTLRKRPWYWESLKAGGESNNRGWDGWMSLLTQWTWIWANSRRQWRTEKPGVLQFMGSQRDRHGLETKLQQQL